MPKNCSRSFLFYLSFILVFIINFKNIKAQLSFNPKPELLTITLMVKNEQDNIIQTLKPFVDANIRSFLIYDTGSTDKTIETAKNYFKQNKQLSCIIISQRFVNFSVSRNRALRLTEKYFKKNKFILMPDAEWYISNANLLKGFCKSQIKTKHNCYLVKLTDTQINLFVPRLFRAHKNITFTESVHEIISAKADFRVPSKIYFTYKPNSSGKLKSKARWNRDRDLLLTENKSKPKNPRTIFYLAQTYACLGDWHNAYKYYLERTKLKGNPEENFMAFYRLAQTLENLSYLEKKDYYRKAISYYLKAYNLRPTRAEPLYAIAKYYFKNNNLALADKFIKKTCKIKYPVRDTICVEKKIYFDLRYQLQKQINQKLKLSQP